MNGRFIRVIRQDYAPIELLTGQKLQKRWIDLLMDKIKDAFDEHKVKSVKKLHQVICSKNQDNTARFKPTNSIIPLKKAA